MKLLQYELTRSLQMVIICSFALLAIFCSSTTVSADVIIVDDDNDANFKNIQDAVDVCEDGDHIFVMPGIYYEDIIISNSISLIGTGNNSTLLIGSEKSPSTITIDAEDTKLIGFNIRNGTYGITVKADRVVIEDNYFSDMHIGIIFAYSQFGISHNNTFHNCSTAGIRLSSSHNNTIMKCIFSNNNRGISFHMDWNNNNLISRCKIIDNRYSGISISGNRNEVNNCSIISHIGKWGIGISIRGDGNQIFDSIISDNNKTAIRLSNSTQTRVQFCTIENNSVGIIIESELGDSIVYMCNIQLNSIAGIQVSSAQHFIQNVSNNWWGDSSGPNHEDYNPNGTGDGIISKNVVISPWLSYRINNIPKIVVISKAGKRVVEGNTSFHGIAWDMDGVVKKVEYSIDGSNWMLANGTNTWSVRWNSAVVADGEYQILFRSWDGNKYSNNDTFILIVDNQNEKNNALTILILQFLLVFVALILIILIMKLFSTSS